MAFNSIIAELFWFVEVMGSNANNAKAWCELLVLKMLELLLQEIEQYLTIQYHQNRRWRRVCGQSETPWAFQVQVCILICHGGCSDFSLGRLPQSTGIKMDWCWHLPLILVTVGCRYWVIDLFIYTWQIRKRFQL
jgi:hypothetical protein